MVAIYSIIPNSCSEMASISPLILTFSLREKRNQTGRHFKTAYLSHVIAWAHATLRPATFGSILPTDRVAELRNEYRD